MIYEQLGYNGGSKLVFQGDFFSVLKNSENRFFTRISENSQTKTRFADQALSFAH